MKCEECITQKRADNCQACYQAEKEKLKNKKELFKEARELHEKALHKHVEEHRATKRQNLKLITSIKNGLRKIVESKKLFNTRHQVFNLLENLEESAE